MDTESQIVKKPAQKFTDLIVWQMAHKLVLGIYRLTKTFPKSELYGLVSQMRRAAVSVPANIAEGFKRKSPADKSRFMNIAEGSLEECRYHLILTQDLGYGNSDEYIQQVDEIGRMLQSYSIKIRNTPR